MPQNINSGSNGYQPTGQTHEHSRCTSEKIAAKNSKNNSDEQEDHEMPGA